MKNLVKILILDDDQDISNCCKESLNKKGYEAYAAYSYDEAIKIVNSKQINIALLDFYLEENKTGMDVLKEIKKVLPQCLCVMVTKEDDFNIIDQARGEGAIDYLTKPLTLKEIDKKMSYLADSINKGGQNGQSS